MQTFRFARAAFVVTLFAALVTPARAETTATLRAPYVASDARQAFQEGQLLGGGQHSEAASADKQTGTITAEAMISTDRLGSIGGGRSSFARGEVMIYDYLPAGLTSVTYTVHVHVARAFGRVAASELPALLTEPSFAVSAFLSANRYQECCPEASGTKSVLTGTKGTQEILNEDVELTISLDHPMDGPVWLEAAVHAGAFSGRQEGTARASVDATVTSVTATYE